MRQLAKSIVRGVARAAGVEVRRVRPSGPDPSEAIIDRSRLLDAAAYAPVFHPWRLPEFQRVYAAIAPYTLVSPDRCHVLRTLARQAIGLRGEIWECGVYRGGTAMLLRDELAGPGRTLRLFDTFAGMPETDASRDFHRRGDFGDTSLSAVRSRLPGEFVSFHPGFIPDSFAGLEDSRIAMAHVDVDIHAAVRDCCEFIYPRLIVGGFMVFDDYGFATCPGARQAVDEFFAGGSVVPLVIPTGQAVAFKSRA